MSQNIWGIDRFDLCKGLNAMEIQEMTKISNKVNYQKGDIITDVNNNTRDIYVLIDGQVDIMSLHGISLYRVSNNETFGELAMVGTIKRTAIAVAREESWVMVINMNHLESLGEEYPSIYKKVYKNIVTSLGVKLARANKLIELLKSELSKSLKNRG